MYMSDVVLLKTGQFLLLQVTKIKQGQTVHMMKSAKPVSAKKENMQKFVYSIEEAAST